MLSTKMLLMKCRSTYDNMLPCNKPDEITKFSHAIVLIFCPRGLLSSLAHVAFKKVMLKLKEQLQIVLRLLLQ